MIKWILKHLKLTTAILAFTITLVTLGSIMLSSYISYQNYEKEYYQKDLNARAAAAAAPTSIDVIDDFVTYNDNGTVKKSNSTLKNNVTAWANKLTPSKTTKVVEGKTVVDSYLPALSSGGKVTVTFKLAKKAFVDIDFVVSSNYKEEDKYTTTEKILSNVYFKVNSQQMDENINLENKIGTSKEWHHIVMSNFALPAGKINIEISNMVGKEAYMPDIRNITVFASAAVTL